MTQNNLSRYRTAGGRTIYRLPLQVFPGFFGNAYVVTGGAKPVLVDVGSGQGMSNRDLERGLAAIGERFGETVEFADLGAILITHGHIDHFGGLGFVRRKSAAPIGVHVLDRRVLTSYEERLLVASQRIGLFLAGAGVGEQRRRQYLEMYLSTKELFESLPVSFSFEEGELLGGELEAMHVPGHCPGQVCLRIDDVLLSADHVLETISPHVSPEAITLHTGFAHYFEALHKVAAVPGIRLGLGGHEGPIADVAGRAAEIRRGHDERLARVIELCAEPRCVLDVSREIFGEVHSYHVLLALLEAGALVEYLHLRGDLVVANLADLEAGGNPVMLYRRA